MIRFIKAKNHKGIEEVSFEELGQTNVICGKNSSGKSSILESLSDEKNFSLGLLVERMLDLEGIFKEQAQKYTSPHPTQTVRWFNAFMAKLYNSETLWFQDKIEDLASMIEIDFNNSNGRQYSKAFSFHSIISSAFKKHLPNYDPILIPPKRKFDTITSINVDEEILPNGKGTVNKLFYLKNHELSSKEFRTYKMIEAEFKEITTYSFNIIPKKDNKIKLQFKVNNSWIDADDCGLGLLDLLFLVAFIYSTDHTTYLIEEPENHLHADFQKKLLGFFRSFKEKQFIISTHSNIFIDSVLVDKIFYCWYDDTVKVSDKTSLSKIVGSLGYSVTENLTADAIILTEGPTDIPIIKRVLELAEVVNNKNIKYWPLGGDIMAALDLSIFSGVKNIYAIIDSDPGSQKIRKTFLNNCKTNQIKAYRLERYSIENYLPLSKIREAFPDQISKRIIELESNQSVDDQIGFKAKNKSIKGKNHIIAANLRRENLEGSDLWDWAIQIKTEL